jgi:hypothetical protein
VNELYLSKFISMKNLVRLLAAGFFCMFITHATAQEEPEQLNLPGDNLNLYAVMKLFQESPTLEDFEKKLNDENNKVNNLDLNGDNQIDYIKVVDNPDGDTHNIALKVAVSQNEDQDVAVFVVNKDRNGQVQIQLIGDEDLYGKDYIIEPDSGPPSSTPNPGYAGNEPLPAAVEDYQVSAWPVVQFIYVPSYTVWRSPWHWGYYPSYWRPWTPFFWHEYYGYQYHWNYYYRTHYRYTPVYRFPTWRDRYYGGGFRSRSVVVETRARQGGYRQTYTRPELASRGADLFRRDHPKAPSVNRPLPQFDNNHNNRPIVNRPDRSYNRPDNGRPNNGNNNRPGDRPVTRPVNPNPGNGNNAPDRPVTRPVNPNPGNGNTFPARPDRPVTRPLNPNPGNGNNTPNRPITRPVNPNPSNNNLPNRPITRPNNVQPAPRPANGNNFPNRPVTRPAAPRPQEARQPVARPVARPDKPARDHRGNQ